MDGIILRVGAKVIKENARKSPEGVLVVYTVKSSSDRVYVYGIVAHLRKDGMSVALHWPDGVTAEMHVKMVNQNLLM